MSTSSSPLTRADAEALDQQNPLLGRRDLFDLPDDVVYLCGNSLGALVHGVPERVAAAVTGEWGADLVSAWNTADWTHLSARVAARIAPLVGARSGSDLSVGDSTSVTLFQALTAAAALRPDRRVLVVEPTTFPTDGYVAQGVARLLGLDLRWCDPADPTAALDEDVAVLCLTQVNFRSGALYDIAAVSAAAHAAGAVTVWDLSHSTGAVPVALEDDGADFAVGCTYKYLNGGPGSPGYLWVAQRHQQAALPGIQGWWGHTRPFAMVRDFEPAEGATRFTVGTPPVLALTALERALEAFEGVDLADVRRVSLSLTDLVMRLVAEQLPDLEILTPAEHERRGSQVALRHPDAYAVVRALIDRGVVGDFREPDVIRWGFAPLYVRHVDAFDAVAALADVLRTGAHRDPVYAQRLAVT